MKILLDMDGVLVDFVSGAMSAHGISMKEYGLRAKPGEWDLNEQVGMTEDQFWGPLQGEWFWTGLKPYPWAKALYEACCVVGDVTIATTPSRDPGCLSGKLKWLHEFFGVEFNDYMMGHEKSLMAKEGVLLIDDNDINCERFEDAGGDTILFPRTWNMLNRKADVAYEYTMGKLFDRCGMTRTV